MTATTYPEELPFNPTVVRLGRGYYLAWAWEEALSIPLWCDWDGVQLRSLHHVFAAFNPTVVRLGRGPHCLHVE